MFVRIQIKDTGEEKSIKRNVRKRKRGRPPKRKGKEDEKKKLLPANKIKGGTRRNRRAMSRMEKLASALDAREKTTTDDEGINVCQYTCLCRHVLFVDSR